MKIKKKFLILIIILFIILCVVFCYLFNNKKELICVNEKNDNIITYKIILNKKINISYDLNYKTMDEVVDNYDNVKAYLDIIKNNDGVETNIKQEEKKLSYSIDYDVKKINEKDYDLYGIKDIVKLKNNKDIIKYFEDMNYKCD